MIERGALFHRAPGAAFDSFYLAAPVNISDKSAMVTVLVRRDPNKQRMYLHAVTLKENLLATRVSAADAKASKPHGSLKPRDANKILASLLRFNPSEVSKVVHPETGEPMVMYHGTTADVSEFRKNCGNILPVYVAAANPFDYENKSHVEAVAIRAGLTRNAIKEVEQGT